MLMEKEEKSNIPQPTTLTQDIWYLVKKILIIIVVMVLLFTFMFGVIRYEDNSMNPAIKDGDLVFCYRLDKNYVMGDCLVLEYQGKKQVRRVVATGGDTVEITKDGLLVNGSIQQEDQIYQETLCYEQGISFPITLKEDQVFVLGDSRETAIDSRMYGAVDKKDTWGKVMVVIRRRQI